MESRIYRNWPVYGNAAEEPGPPSGTQGVRKRFAADSSPQAVDDPRRHGSPEAGLRETEAGPGFLAAAFGGIVRTNGTTLPCADRSAPGNQEEQENRRGERRFAPAPSLVSYLYFSALMESATAAAESPGILFRRERYR